jgi:hypothetical protein
MKSSFGVILIFVSLPFGLASVYFSYRLTRDVARVAPPKTNKPYQNFVEATNFARVWREHLRHFPRNSRRRAYVVVTAIGVACFVVGVILAA